MVPSLDCAVSSLLCAEDNTIFYDDDDDDFGDVCFGVDEHRNHRMSNPNQNQNFYDDVEALGFYGPPLQSEECLTMMVEKECQHLPATDYLMRFKNGDLDLQARMEAIDWISKVHAHYNFGPLCAYLSISYFDRFLSAYELPKGKAWMTQLLAVACLSLAAKMEETEVPLSLDLQVGESKFIFEAKTIQRMELLVLNTLKWRMQPVTPFSFLDSFIQKIIGDRTISRSSISESVQIILSTTRDIDFFEFRPSEIAAAVAISVIGETQTLDNDKAIDALNQLVQKDKIMKCVELMKDLRGFVMIPTVSVPQSPIGVLDAACLSYKTSDDVAVESCTNSSHNNPVAKRRKLNRPL